MSNLKKLKMIVVEDNPFYNKMLYRQLHYLADKIAVYKKLHFKIESYAHYDDFLRNFSPNTQIVFLDFYLGNSTTALDIIDEIKQKNDSCKIVIISKSNHFLASEKTICCGADAFIPKDKEALKKVGHFVEEYVSVNFS